MKPKSLYSFFSSVLTEKLNVIILKFKVVIDPLSHLYNIS